jgi:prepilin-type N-terminal cleavage/methylation domain-containing protein
MRQLGLSLVELMVAIAVASFIALAATLYYSSLFSASSVIRESTAAQGHFNAVASALIAEIRRSGYRGYPGRLPTYLETTGSNGGIPDEGDYPAIEIGSDCLLTTYVRDHTCRAGDQSDFAECVGGEGTAAGLYYRVGLRLTNGEIEAVSVIHPNQYLSGAPSDSECTASGASSAWERLTTNTELYFDRFSITQEAQTIYEGDTGCVLGTVGTDCESNVFADCGDTISCRIKRIYKIELCAYVGATDDLCDPDFGSDAPERQYYNELFVTPRNDVLISKDYDT